MTLAVQILKMSFGVIHIKICYCRLR